MKYVTCNVRPSGTRRVGIFVATRGNVLSSRWYGVLSKPHFTINLGIECEHRSRVIPFGILSHFKRDSWAIRWIRITMLYSNSSNCVHSMFSSRIWDTICIIIIYQCQALHFDSGHAKLCIIALRRIDFAIMTNLVCLRITLKFWIYYLVSHLDSASTNSICRYPHFAHAWNDCAMINYAESNSKNGRIAKIRHFNMIG